MHKPTFPVLLMAAGASRRMGRPKALLPWGRGSLLDHAIGQARVLGDEVTVLTGAYYPLLRYRTRRQPTRWRYVAGWRDGMSESLKVGLSSLAPSVPGVFVMVMDQPLLSVSGLAALRDAALGHPSWAFAADYRGRAGVPAYLPRRLWPLVAQLEGDRGAGALLNDVGAERVAIAGVFEDADTPADWLRLKGL